MADERKQFFSGKKFPRACSANPGNFFNQFSPNRYGKIKEGYIGSLTILNINKPTTITKDILKTKCGWSPFEGIKFIGSLAMTIIKGVAFAKASADRRNI